MLNDWQTRPGDHCWIESRRRSCGNPGPSSKCSSAVRPLTASINADTGPLTSAPVPHVRLISLPCKRIPRNRLSGTKPNGQGPVRKSIASAANCGSGSKGRPSGILMSPPCTRTSASGSSGPNNGGLIGRSAHRRKLATISSAGSCARCRASSSIARAMLPRRTARQRNAGVPSTTVLTMCAATVLTSQPAQRLGVASCAWFKPSSRLAIRRRSSATAANTKSRSARITWSCRGLPAPAFRRPNPVR